MNGYRSRLVYTPNNSHWHGLVIQGFYRRIRTAYDVVLPASHKVQLLRGLRVSFAIVALAAAGVGPGSAQAPDRDLLNSERIAAAFGSYAVEVLAQDDGVRIANLYSSELGVATCRTLAIVRYPPTVDALVSGEHAAIVAGGSIGSVFAERGWQVRKTHLYYGEIEASARLAGLMRIAPGTRLAEHVYVLDVAKGERVIEYAALVEIHHPDYLRPADLARIYGPADAAARPALVAGLLAIARERSR